MPTAKLLATCAFVSVLGALGGASGDGSLIVRPGAMGRGVTLLPNGWKIAPAGKHVQVGSLPLAMVESPDGRTLFIASNGYLKPAIIAVDIKSQRVVDTLVLDHAWVGLAWNPDGSRLYVSGAGNNTVHELRWETRRVTPAADGDERCRLPFAAPSFGGATQAPVFPRWMMTVDTVRDGHGRAEGECPPFRPPCKISSPRRSKGRRTYL